MGCGGFVHSRVRPRPSFSAVIAYANPAFVVGNVLMTPHFRTRQIMRVAIHAPHAATNFGVKRKPICRIQPFLRHAFGGALPTRATVFATEQTYVDVPQ